jgi:hypothetical protein
MKFLLIFAMYEDEWQKVDKSAKFVDNCLKLCKRLRRGFLHVLLFHKRGV